MWVAFLFPPNLVGATLNELHKIVQSGETPHIVTLRYHIGRQPYSPKPALPCGAKLACRAGINIERAALRLPSNLYPQP